MKNEAQMKPMEHSGEPTGSPALEVALSSSKRAIRIVGDSTRAALPAHARGRLLSVIADIACKGFQRRRLGNSLVLGSRSLLRRHSERLKDDAAPIDCPLVEREGL